MRMQTAPGVWLEMGPAIQHRTRSRGSIVALMETRPKTQVQRNQDRRDRKAKERAA